MKRAFSFIFVKTGCCLERKKAFEAKIYNLNSCRGHPKRDDIWVLLRSDPPPTQSSVGQNGRSHHTYRDAGSSLCESRISHKGDDLVDRLAPSSCSLQKVDKFIYATLYSNAM